MLWYVLNGLYLIIWSALLIHCLFRREFYPIFGPKWGTKVLWLLTFVFFNPLLTLIYFIFGFLLRPAKAQKRGKLIGFGSVVVIGCVGIVIVLFEWPLSGYKAKPVVIQSESGKEKPTDAALLGSGFEPHAGIIEAKNNVQTVSSTSAGDGAKVSTRSVLLICQHPHHLLDRTTRMFQKSLVRLPYVDKVAYYPFGTRPEPGGILPDVFITIDMPRVNENNFFRGRKLKAVIKWKAGSSMFPGPSHSVRAYMPPVVNFNIEGQLDHESRMVGIESPQSKYKLEADNISGEMIKSISKQFESLLDKHGQLPRLPEKLYGTYHEPPEFSFIRDDMVLWMISGRGLFKNNHTVWRFVDERGTEEALTAYHDELQTVGWSAEDISKEYLQMQKGNEHIYIFCQPRRDLKSGAIVGSDPQMSVSSVPMIAHYESYLTNDQMQKAMDALLGGGVEVKTLLVFEKFFHTPQQQERLRSIIEHSSVHTLDGYLAFVRYWADHNEMEKGRESLLCARAMQRAEKGHNVKAQEIKSLAKKLGDEGLADVPIGEDIFSEMGFINAEQLTKRLEIERALDEPVLFYRRLDSGDLHTFALRIVCSREPSPSVPYRLLTVEKRKDRSSSSETDGKIKPDGVWITDSSLNGLTRENKSIHLKVEGLGNERFLFAITP